MQDIPEKKDRDELMGGTTIGGFVRAVLANGPTVLFSFGFLAQSSGLLLSRQRRKKKIVTDRSGDSLLRL